MIQHTRSMRFWKSKSLFLFLALAGFIAPAWAQLVPNFSADITRGCEGSPVLVNFRDLTTGNPTGWLWDFGDGTTSNLQNPSHAYLKAGNYSVSLFVTNAANPGGRSIAIASFIEILPKPVIRFTQDKFEGCPPLNVNFNFDRNANIQPIDKYFWAFSDGAFDTTSNPSVTFTNSGTIDLTLTVTDINGCESTSRFNSVVNVYPNPPSPDFTADQVGKCEPPITVNIRNTTNENGATDLTYLWLFPAGDPVAFSGKTPPAVTYDVQGGYDVTMIVTNARGCRDTVTKSNFISVGDVSANFSVSSQTVCLGDTLSLFNTSIGGSNSLSWNFGDGNTSTAINPKHVYRAEGTYTVVLTVNNPDGCSDTRTRVNYIRVLPPAVADFALDNPAVCDFPVTYSFSDSSSNASSWTWDFGDGGSSTEQNPRHTYASAGSYPIRLIISNSSGCSDTLTRITNIRAGRPVVDFEAPTASGCIPLTVAYNDLSTVIGSTITSWQWTLPGANPSTSNARNPSVEYRSPGIYDAELTVTAANGCTNTLRLDNYIRVGTPPPTADIISSIQELCIKEPLNFKTILPPGTDSTLYIYKWDFEYEEGDFQAMSFEKSPPYVYNNVDTFSVAMVIENQGCTDTVVKEEYIRVKGPQALFSLSESLVCSFPNSIAITNQTIGPADSYRWFLDGVLHSTLQNPPPISIGVIGPHEVKLVVRSALTGCVDSLIQTVNTGQTTAQFTTLDLRGCSPHRVRFQNNSIRGISYLWNFGIGDTVFSTDVNPTITFTAPGIYPVTLTSIDAFGCKDTETLSIEVGGPIVNFEGLPRSGCAPQEVRFTDLSRSGPPIVSWSWNFGDPASGGLNTSNLQNPVHSYADTGAYTVTLEVRDQAGCPGIITFDEYIKITQPRITFQVDDSVTCAGNVLNFSNNSIGDSLEFLWDFGDGNTLNQRNPQYAYAKSGTYTVRLIVDDKNGCRDTLIKPNYITIETLEALIEGRPAGQANYQTTPIVDECAPLNVNFISRSQGNISRILWDFGDGTTSDRPDPGKTYTRPGTYDVGLRVEHIDGCIDRAYIQDFVQIGGPEGSATTERNGYCVGDSVEFKIATLGACVINLDYRDGESETFRTNCIPGIVDTLTVKHAFRVSQKYAVSVVLYDKVDISDPDVCVSTFDVDTIEIFPFPTADFIGDTVACAPANAQFIDASTPSDSALAPIVEWNWRFGVRNSASNLQNPRFRYVNTGLYSVSLRIEDVNGCTDSVTKRIRIQEPISAAFFASDSVSCAPSDIAFTDISTNGTAASWRWNFGDGSQVDTTQRPFHRYQRPGTYTVSLRVTDVLGCTDSLTKRNYIVLRNPEAIANINRQVGCAPTTLTFYGDESLSDTVITRYTWCVTQLSNNRRICSPNPIGLDSLQYRFVFPGDYNIQLVAEDILGCRDSSEIVRVTIQDRAKPLPIQIRSVSVLSDNSVIINFNPYTETDFVEYAVYRFDGNTPVLVGNIRDQFLTTYIDTFPGLDCSENIYCYKVLVKNECQEFSLIDDTREHCTIEVSALPGQDEVALTWNPYIGWEVGQYLIFRAGSYDLNSLVQIGSVDGDLLSFTDSTNFCGDSVIYRILAIDAANTVQSFSDIVPTAPIHNAPNVGANVAYASVTDENNVEIAWPPYRELRPASFFLERSINGVRWDSLATFGPATRAYVDTTVDVLDFSYYYRLTLVDSCGDKTPLGLIGKTILLDGKFSSQGAIPTLNWSRYEDWPQGVANYDLEVFNESRGVYEVVESINANQFEFADNRTQLAQGQFCYRIKAYEAAGLGSISVSNQFCLSFVPQVYAPSAFSPNDDGNNDLFLITVPSIGTAELMIYNRWGKLLYRTIDLTQGWDGTFEGKTVPEGVYVFVVSGTGEDGSPFTRNGTITVIK